MFGLDFVNDLTATETLSTAVWTIDVRYGVDPAPASHLVGPPVLVVPVGTTLQTATVQRISGLLPDVTYTVRAVVTTNAGNMLSLWSHIRGEPVE
jgi:hypothetical protein